MDITDFIRMMLLKWFSSMRYNTLKNVLIKHRFNVFEGMYKQEIQLYQRLFISEDKYAMKFPGDPKT